MWPAEPIELAFLLQDFDDPYNVGGMFRVADACGASLFGSGNTAGPENPQVGVTSMGGHRRVAWEHLGKHEPAALALIEKGYTLVAIEIASEAQHFMEFDYPEKVCLVLGNEGKGVYQAVMKHCSGAVMIPMCGKGRSLNVHVAGAIVGFHAMLIGTVE